MSFLTFDSYYSPSEGDGHLVLSTSVPPGRSLRMAAPSPPSPSQHSRPLKPLMPATRTRPIPRMPSEGLVGTDKIAKPIRQVTRPPSRTLAQDPHQRPVLVSSGGGRRRAMTAATTTATAAATTATATLSPTHRSVHLASSGPRVLSLAKERLRQSIKERLAAKLRKEHTGNVSHPPPLLGLPPRNSTISSEQERFILELARRDSELQRVADARRRRKSSNGGRSPGGSEGKVWDLDVKAWTTGADGTVETSFGGSIGSQANALLMTAMRSPRGHSMAHPDEMLTDWTSNDSQRDNMMPRWEESSPSAVSMGSHQGGCGGDSLQEEWDLCLGEFFPALLLPLPHTPSERRELSEREFTDLFLNPTMAGGNHVAPSSIMMVMPPPPPTTATTTTTTTTTVAPLTAYLDPTEMHHSEYPKASFWGF